MVARRFALGGVVGPAAFIGAWLAGAATTVMDYSSVDDAISRLAAVGADTRWLMSTGFIVFGLGLPAFALAHRRGVGGWGWVPAALTGLATLAVAAAPLDRSSFVDTLHGVFATFGYITLVAVPLASFRPLRDAGHSRLALGGIVAAAVSTVSLALSSSGLPTGFFQRLGLTSTDVWIIATALLMATGRIGGTGTAHRPSEYRQRHGR